mgnify:CR=1 FL=1
MQTSSLNPGGIDFNPARMNIQTRGGAIQMSAPIGSAGGGGINDFTSENFPVINQFNPVIIQIIPIPNFSLLLGLSEKKEEVKIVTGT